MRWLIALAAAVWVACSLPAGAAADEKLVKAILAEWQVRKTRVKTVKCSAKVESLFTKGYLSREFKNKAAPPQPPADQRFTNQSCSWALDFAHNRVRVECELIRPWIYSDSQGELALERSVHLVNNGKYRLFHPKGSYPEKSKDNGSIQPDVWFHEEASHSFVLNSCDHPILWMGGGLSGQWPRPTNLRYSDSPERFMFRGEIIFKGRKCVVLAVPEQQSATAVREFWVDIENPYRIYRCRALEGTNLYGQLEVQYNEQDGYTIPVRWTSMSFKNGQFNSSETYFTEKIEINTTLPQQLFESPLEPGMIVFHTLKNTAFEVDQSGKLVPLGSTPRSNLAFWLGLASASMALTVLIWWLLRKRSQKSQV